ncbi:hypothetical protein GCM10027168_32280 [Streptomyces capparidis]
MTAEQVAGGPAAGARQALTGCYVYGVVPRTADARRVEELPGVGDPEARIRFVPGGGVAAVVSDVRTDRPLGMPEDLRAHARVLDALAAADVPVAPFRFGTVLPDERAVSDELLGQGRDDFAAVLRTLDGRAQFTVRARYVPEAVVAEVVADDPGVARLREEVAALPEDASYYRRIELGRVISEAVEARRRRDAAVLMERLDAFAVASKAAEAAAGEGLVDASFLVERGSREAFEREAERLAHQWQGRVRVRLLGPLAPYDYVDDAMRDAREGRPSWG